MMLLGLFLVVLVLLLLMMLVLLLRGLAALFVRGRSRSGGV
jgi:hypothetical protein